MSTYETKLVHPVTGKLTKVLCIDDYFAHREYGYRFDGDKVVYSQDEIDAMQPNNASYPDK